MKHLVHRAAIGAALLVSLVLATALPADAVKPPSIQVKPWTFVGKVGDCGPTAGTKSAPDAKWVTKGGLPDAGGSNHALYLQKFAATSDCSAAGATVSGVSGTNLTEIGFDVRDDGHCGAGAPRFNVVTSDNVTHFFGCAYGTHTSLGNGWTRVRQTGADAFPPVLATDVVTNVDLVFDEGTDQGQGFVYLDNIDYNGALAGKPGAS